MKVYLFILRFKAENEFGLITRLMCNQMFCVEPHCKAIKILNHNQRLLSIQIYVSEHFRSVNIVKFFHNYFVIKKLQQLNPKRTKRHISYTHNIIKFVVQLPLLC